MKKYITLAIILSAFFAGNSDAQITITKDYYTSLFGKRIDYTVVNLPTDAFELNNIVKNPQDGKLVDFVALQGEYLSNRDYSVRYRKGTDANPFDDQEVFANSDMFTITSGGLLGDTLKYAFYIFSNDALNMVGYGEIATSKGYLNMNQFGEPVLVQKFPLGHEQSWMISNPWELPSWASKKGSAIVNEELPSFRYENVVDTWGRMYLEFNVVADMIRVSTVKIYDILYNPIMGFEYTYLSNDGHYVKVETTNAGVITKAEMGIAQIVGDINTSNPNDRSDLPDGFALDQNYPNPFNPSTNISYSIPYSADVTLQVVDLTGRVVSRMEMPRQSAGTHKVALDASHLSSGVYLYRIQAGGYAASRKFTLIK